MYWIALTLGFFGSLHCIGMCGPLAAAVLSSRDIRGISAVFPSLLYNIGRTLGYIFLGLLFGLLGSVVALSGLQRVVSILIGAVMLLFFLFSINPDHLISKQTSLQKIYKKVSDIMYSLLKKSSPVSTFNLGLINGFLPCGLVYLAIAGSLSLSNIWGGMGFMLFFGLGTFPAMLGFSLGHSALSNRFRMSLRKIYPILTFAIGLYLIYRGTMSKLPLELNFFEALKNPIMCH